MPKGIHKHHAYGSRCGRWNGEKILSSGGYTKIRVGKNHPLADPNGYAYEHIVVWVSAGNQRPSTKEVIHHLNGDKADNRIENLCMITRSEHNRIHNADKSRDTSGQFSGRVLDGRTWEEYPEAHA